MTFNVSVVKDSISQRGVRLTTVECTYPRIVHSEFMTHRVFTRSSASTRAIPLSTQIRNLIENPFVPEKFGTYKSGMQAGKNLTGRKHEQAVEIQLNGLARSLTTAIEFILGQGLAGEVLGYNPQREFVDLQTIRLSLDQIVNLIPKSSDAFKPEDIGLLNVHKQLAGRGLEPYMWHTVVITGTDWENFLALRNHSDAQPEIQTPAKLIQQALSSSAPKLLDNDQWHLPYVEEGEFEDLNSAIVSSVARIAATSYNRQSIKNPEKERIRHDTLLAGGHMSPFEPVAKPFTQNEWSYFDRIRDIAVNVLRATPHEDEGQDALHEFPDYLSHYLESALSRTSNFRGWHQYRKFIKHEDNFAMLQAER